MSGPFCSPNRCDTCPQLVCPERSLSPNFDLWEFACGDKCGGEHHHLQNLRTLTSYLEIIRREAGGHPTDVVSGYRCPPHNAAAGGAKKSRHMAAIAADIRIAGIQPKDLKAIVQDCIDRGLIPDGGLAHGATIVHYDFRTELGQRAQRWTY